MRLFRLGTEPGDDLTTTTTVGERLAMMWPLALDAWTLAGLPLAFLGRAELVRNKRATGRAKDRADREALGEEA